MVPANATPIPTAAEAAIVNTPLDLGVSAPSTYFA